MAGSATPQPFTVTNTGAVPLRITSTGIAGVAPSQYAVSSDSCTGTTLAPAATCVVDVAFTPTAPGFQAATLTVADDAPDSPQAASLGGIGSTFALTPSSSEYGSQGVAAGPTPTRSFVLTNTTPALAAPIAAPANAPSTTITVASVVISGPDASQFSLASDECTGHALTHGTACVVKAAFAPTSAGAKSATLGFITSDGAVTTSVLTGAGTSVSLEAPPAPHLPALALSGLSFRPYALHLCAPHGHHCFQRTARVAYSYAGADGKLQLTLVHTVRGHRHLVFNKPFAIRRGKGAYVFPRRYLLPRGIYTVTLEAFVGARHSNIVSATLRVR